MPSKRSRVHTLPFAGSRFVLLAPVVVAVGLLGTACDPGGESDAGDPDDPSEFVEDTEVPGHAEVAALDLVTDVDTPVTALLQVTDYLGVSHENAIADGDVVMIRNWNFGYLGCVEDGFGTVSSQHPFVLDPYAWLVHRIDLDGDGTDELQFERLDDGVGTGIYLKMRDDGVVFSGPITGIGDAAAWNTGNLYAGPGFYQRTARQLVNYKHDACLLIDPNGEGKRAATCNGYAAKLFTFEIIAPA